MPVLYADESHYVLATDVREAAHARRIPGLRWSSERNAWLFTQSTAGLALVRALDRVFGAQGWLAGDEFVQTEAAAARERVFAQAQNPAHITRDGPQLAVECTFTDKDLLRLVPGYRWSPRDKRWFVPAMPLSLEILQDAFGPLLHVDDEAAEYLALKRIDEQQEIERTLHLPVTPLAQPQERPIVERPPASQAATLDASIEDKVDRLLQSVERLEQMMALLTSGASMPPNPAPPQQPQHRSGDEVSPESVREPEPAARESQFAEMLALAERDAALALETAQVRLQVAETEDTATLHAIAGVAALANGSFEIAFRHLNTAMNSPLVEPFAESAAAAYKRTVLELVNIECGPTAPIRDLEGFQERLLEELRGNSGFDRDAISSEASRTHLELFVTDRFLGRAEPLLRDYCRILHLVSTVRGGASPLVRIANVVREEGLAPEAFALGAMLYANALQSAGAAEVESIDSWEWRWPEAADTSTAGDGANLVARALEVFPALEGKLTLWGAVAILACIAPLPAHVATLKQRRALLDYLPRTGSWRRYGEFLAVFALAPEGERINAAHFPGYIEMLAKSRLENSAAHLELVLYNGDPTLSRAIADDAYLSAVRRGVTDPVSQVLDLLDLLDGGSHPDNLLNDLADMVEDERSFPGAKMFARDQRELIYRRALSAALRLGHDEDARKAFQRLVRHLWDEASTEKLRALCGETLTGYRPLRARAVVLLAEILLDEGSPMTEVAEMIGRSDIAQLAENREVVADLLTLGDIYPEHRAEIRALIPEAAAQEEPPAPSFPGRHVVLVGGHQRMKGHGLPLLQGWSLDVDWLDATEAKNGEQLPALCRGACDLVVINTAYIGHAASGRAKEVAESAGKPVLMNNTTGVGSTLLGILERLSEPSSAEAPAPRRDSKVSSLRRTVRR